MLAGRRPRTAAEIAAAYARESAHPSAFAYTPAAKRAWRAAALLGAAGVVALIAFYFSF
jgi:hypothetical protein